MPQPTNSPDAAKRQELVGWLNEQTGEYWGIPEGHQAPNYTVGTEWIPVYRGDKIVGPWSVQRVS